MLHIKSSMFLSRSIRDPSVILCVCLSVSVKLPTHGARSSPFDLHRVPSARNCTCLTSHATVKNEQVEFRVGSTVAIDSDHQHFNCRSDIVNCPPGNDYCSLLLSNTITRILSRFKKLSLCYVLLRDDPLLSYRFEVGIVAIVLSL